MSRGKPSLCGMSESLSKQEKKEVDHQHPANQDKRLSIYLPIMLAVNSEFSFSSCSFGIFMVRGIWIEFQNR